MKIITRAAIIRLAVLVLVVILFCFWGYFTMIKFPAKSYKGPLPEVTAEQIKVNFYGLTPVAF